MLNIPLSAKCHEQCDHALLASTCICCNTFHQPVDDQDWRTVAHRYKKSIWKITQY